MRGVTVAALLLASAQAPLGSTLIAVALPSIGDGIETDLVLVTSLLVTGYLVVNVVCQGPAGKISDLVGHARILWAGISLYVIGAACGLVAQDVGLLLMSRITMALAGALVVPATLALLRLHVPAECRGRVFGLFGATMGLAAAGGPALGGEIVNLLGWRAIFLANLPFLALAAILLRTFPIPQPVTFRRHTAAQLARSIDFAGVGLLALALSLLILSSKSEGFTLAITLIATLAAGITFIAWEAKTIIPVFDPRLFALPAFAAGTTIIALQNFAMYGLLFELPQFFSLFRHAAPREVGYMLFVMMIGMVIAAPIGGQLTDRIGSRFAALLGFIPLFVGVLMLWRLASFTAPGDAVHALLLFGVGMGLSSAPAQSAAMSAVNPERAGMAAGASSTMRYLGGIVSILVLGAVLGSDSTVSFLRHDIMIRLFTAAVLLSVLAAFRLPGKPSAAAISR
ncbi:MFS transporter [Defluviimonas aestuarii]|uniref:MFS transporter n=1 Tax=Albidovulum aestuarii TaxID=1130726 RepID=UPI00249CE70A|nr:MFS transporter [Defluviimonas aestuarii]MDI3338822.1 MFS transporter [Defluviimonas aestuarii]